jgi:hypothetical protein
MNPDIRHSAFCVPHSPFDQILRRLTYQRSFSPGQLLPLGYGRSGSPGNYDREAPKTGCRSTPLPGSGLGVGRRDGTPVAQSPVAAQHGLAAGSHGCEKYTRQDAGWPECAESS